MPIEQGQDALPLGFGGRAQETEVADALQAPWQDVLEETVQEAFVKGSVNEIVLFWRPRRDNCINLGAWLGRCAFNILGQSIM